MLDAVNSSLHTNELLSLEAGAICYMMSKQGYLSDRDATGIHT
jgi:hypothetical protein